MYSDLYDCIVSTAKVTARSPDTQALRLRMIKMSVEKLCFLYALILTYYKETTHNKIPVSGIVYGGRHASQRHNTIIPLDNMDGELLHLLDVASQMRLRLNVDDSSTPPRRATQNPFVI